MIGTPRAARLGQQRQSLRAGQMHNVDRRLELLGQPDEQRNRFNLRGVWPRGQIGGILAPIRAGCVERIGGSIDRAGNFGVGQQAAVRSRATCASASRRSASSTQAKPSMPE